mmetsp:Transcript_58332/g.103660  ORF Transcript_58332/g.103660 Transcript_58332/m.103660 type:complete len:202 (+) Transcript_58332:640-1245(+)
MRVSDVSARSETNLSRSKSMLAPLVTATKVLSSQAFCCAYFLSPAAAKAPAGSSTTRVSMKESLIAAQMSSVVTVTISSQTIRHRRKVSSPTFLTAAPSAKSPTVDSSTISPAFKLSVMAAESTASTPMTLIDGFTVLRKTPTPDRRPPPPTQQKTASTSSLVVCSKISFPMVPCPAMTRGSLKGCTKTLPSSSMQAKVAA